MHTKAVKELVAAAIEFADIWDGSSSNTLTCMGIIIQTTKARMHIVAALEAVKAEEKPQTHDAPIHQTGGK